MAGEEKLLSDAVTVCSTSSWLVQTTVVPGATVMVAGTMLKFSMLTDGPPDVSTGWAGLGGGRVASAAGGTGVDSPEAGETVAAAGRRAAREWHDAYQQERTQSGAPTGPSMDTNRVR